MVLSFCTKEKLIDTGNADKLFLCKLYEFTNTLETIKESPKSLEGPMLYNPKKILAECIIMHVNKNY